MTDQDPQYQSNQENKSLPEGSVQPPMATPVPENTVQPPMMAPVPENTVQPVMMGEGADNSVQTPIMGQGLENPAQWPMMEQGSENPIPNTGLLTFVFFLNIGYLGLFISSALIAGGWAIAFLFFMGSHLISYIIATVLLGIGRTFASKEILFVSVAFFFISMFLAGDPDWFLFRIPSIISTILVLIGTLLL